MAKLFLYLPIVFVVILLGGCGATPEQKEENAILSAQIYLSSKSCQKAIDILEEHGRNNRNASYLKTLSAAYACRAGFSVPTFFSKDIPVVGTPVVIGGMARFSTSSSMDDPDNLQFRDLQEAIDILLYAGGLDKNLNPTLAARAMYFNNDEAGDINAQLMYLLMAQIGKYIYYYGNSSAAGVKGGGAGLNKCFYNYDGAINITYDIAGPVTETLNSFLTTGGQTGACNALASGHSKLTTGKRLCQGVVMFNNFLEIFPTVIDSVSSDDLNALKNIKDQILDVTGYVTAPDISGVKTVLSQAKCEAENVAPFNNLQVYFAFYYETLFK
jgi:hypothetical protein